MSWNPRGTLKERLDIASCLKALQSTRGRAPFQVPRKRSASAGSRGEFSSYAYESPGPLTAPLTCTPRPDVTNPHCVTSKRSASASSRNNYADPTAEPSADSNNERKHHGIHNQPFRCSTSRTSMTFSRIESDATASASRPQSRSNSARPSAAPSRSASAPQSARQKRTEHQQARERDSPEPEQQKREDDTVEHRKSNIVVPPPPVLMLNLDLAKAVSRKDPLQTPRDVKASRLQVKRALAARFGATQNHQSEKPRTEAQNATESSTTVDTVANEEVVEAQQQQKENRNQPERKDMEPIPHDPLRASSYNRGRITDVEPVEPPFSPLNDHDKGNTSFQRESTPARRARGFRVDLEMTRRDLGDIPAAFLAALRDLDEVPAMAVLWTGALLGTFLPNPVKAAAAEEKDSTAEATTNGCDDEDAEKPIPAEGVHSECWTRFKQWLERGPKLFIRHLQLLKVERVSERQIRIACSIIDDAIHRFGSVANFRKVLDQDTPTCRPLLAFGLAFTSSSEAAFNKRVEGATLQSP